MHRDHLSPRLELTPLLDVVFLLLTFFIYAVAVMIRSEYLPVELAGVAGVGPATGAPQHVLVIAADGSLRLNDEPIDDLALTNALGRLGDTPLHVALDAESSTDRGPSVWRLLEQIQAAGHRNVGVVGRPVSP